MKKPNTRWECQAPERPAPGSRRPARRSILPATSSRQEGHQQSPAMCAPGARRARSDVLSPHPADQAPVPRQRPRRPRWSLYTAGSRFRRRPIIPSIGARRSGTAIRGSFPGEHGRQAPWSVRPGRGPGPRARGDSGRNRSRKQTRAASGPSRMMCGHRPERPGCRVLRNRHSCLVRPPCGTAVTRTTGYTTGKPPPDRFACNGTNFATTRARTPEGRCLPARESATESVAPAGRRSAYRR